MANKKLRFDEFDASESKLFAFIGVFLLIIGFFLVYGLRRRDKYAMFYAKQGIVLFVLALIAAIATAILGWIPIVGAIIGAVCWIVFLAFWLLGLVYSLSNKEQWLPLIGKYAKMITV